MNSWMTFDVTRQKLDATNNRQRLGTSHVWLLTSHLPKVLVPRANFLPNTHDIRSEVMTARSSVAVIEDDADERVALGRVLRTSGFDVKSYASAEQYLASGSVEVPLCLLLDMQLEGMSGLELLRAIRAVGSTVPVIVVTATDDLDVRSEALQLGCAAYLRKPFQGRALVALLRALAVQPREPSHQT